MKHSLLSGNNSGNTKLVSWMKKNGTKISADPYSTGKTSSARQGMTGGPGGQSQQTLYEMKNSSERGWIVKRRPLYFALEAPAMRRRYHSEK
ncbi:hypothetical protein QNN00_03960 [Bacillus velezensis]|nr:hypothetical protein [Bacillus velezensis]